jgi:CHAT domain-containing protein
MLLTISIGGLMKLGVIRQVATVLGAAGLCAISAGIQAQPPVNQQADRISELERAANALVAQGDGKKDARARIIAAYRLVIEEAERTDGANTPAHPAIGRAKIAIASQLYADGQYDAAMQSVEEGLAIVAAGPEADPQADAEGTALRGVILTHTGRAGEAMAALEEGHARFAAWFDSLDEDAKTTAAIVTKSNLEFALAETASRTGQADAALVWQRASLATRRAGLGDKHPDTIASMYNLALALNRAGQGAEAENFAREAVAIADQHADRRHSSRARSLEALGIILSRNGRPIEATPLLLQALDMKREAEGGDSLFFGYGVHNLGTIFLERGRYEDALPLFEEAAPIFASHQGEDSPFAVGSRARIGQILYALGRDDEAAHMLQPLEGQLAAQEKDSESLARIRPDLARAHYSIGQKAEAAQTAQRHLASITQSGEIDPFVFAHARLLDARYSEPRDNGMLKAAADDLIATLHRRGIAAQAGFIESRHRGAIDLVMDSAVALADPQIAYRAIWLMGASELAEASRMRVERSTQDDAMAAESGRRKQEAALAADAAYRDWIAAYSSDADALTARAHYEAALRAAQNATVPRDGSVDGHTDLPDLSALQSGIAPGEALLAIVPVYSGTFLLAVKQGDAIVVKSDLSRAQTVSVTRRLGDSLRTATFDKDAAHMLGEGLFPAEVRHFLQDIDRLETFTIGALASLPLTMLDLAQDDASPQWLGDRFALSTAGSIEPGARQIAHREVARDPLRFVAFADPASFTALSAQTPPIVAGGASIAAYYSRDGIDRAALAGLPPLNGGTQEAEAIAALPRMQQAGLFTGKEVTERKVRSALPGGADIVLFAVHGLVAGEVEGIAEPALVLFPGEQRDGSFAEEDGVLTASEIARLSLSADWVILSSCNSAAGLEGGPSAFSGLAAAFRYAGANSLLVTHWPVRDDLAAFVGARTIENYLSGMTKADALRDAQRALRESGLPQAEEPWAWAPFALIE